MHCKSLWIKASAKCINVNVQGKLKYEVDRTDIEAYIGLLILCGLYKSRNENVASLWDADTGRANICKAHAKFICESCE